MGTEKALPITNALNGGLNDEDEKDKELSDIEQRMAKHRRNKSDHYKKMGRRDSDLSDDPDDIKAVVEEEKRINRRKQGQRKNTLDKIFTNYGGSGLQERDENGSNKRSKSNGRNRDKLQ